jgi:hypothetical protein
VKCYPHVDIGPEEIFTVVQLADVDTDWDLSPEVQIPVDQSWQLTLVDSELFDMLDDLAGQSFFCFLQVFGMYLHERDVHIAEKVAYRLHLTTKLVVDEDKRVFLPLGLHVIMLHILTSQ